MEMNASPLKQRFIDQEEHELYSVLEFNGKFAEGISAMEVWILQGMNLVQPPGGFWRSLNFQPHDSSALERLENSTRSDYVPPSPVLPGTGIAGVLWNDNVCSQQKTHWLGLGFGKVITSSKQTAPPVSFRKSPLGRSFQSLTNLHADFRHTGSHVMTQSENVLGWRDVRSILHDPYQPTFQRLALMERVGLSQCAGIKFEASGGVKGILLLFAGAEVPKNDLNSSSNVNYVRAMANHVGSTMSLMSRRSRVHTTTLNTRFIPERTDKETNVYRSNVRIYLSKLRGGRTLEPPPPMPLDEAMLTFMGVFLTLMTLYYASDFLQRTTGYEIIMGPFGALMTLQYGLTMAPVGQPRNVLLGQTVATVVALIFSRIPNDWLHRSIRISLSTATAITAKVLLGIAHPPAGATALIVSSGEFSWKILQSIILSNLIAIVLSTLINNLSSKRQYPTFLRMGEGYIVKVGKMKMCQFLGHGQSSTDNKTPLVSGFRSPPLRQHTKDLDNNEVTRSSRGSLDNQKECTNCTFAVDDEESSNNPVLKTIADSRKNQRYIASPMSINYGSMFISPFAHRFEDESCEDFSSVDTSDLEVFPVTTDTSHG